MKETTDTWEVSPIHRQAIVTETPYYDPTDSIWAYDVEKCVETIIKPSRDNTADYEASNDDGDVLIAWNDHYYIVQSIDLMDLPNEELE
jgi:hypothetical protein